MAMNTRRIKCRYCDFTLCAWYTNKQTGEKYSGMTRMMHHVQDNHTPTYELQRILDEEEYGEEQETPKTY